MGGTESRLSAAGKSLGREIARCLGEDHVGVPEAGAPGGAKVSEDKMLSSRQEIASFLKVSTKTVDRLIRCGLPVGRPLGGESAVYISVKTLVGWMEKKKAE